MVDVPALVCGHDGHRARARSQGDGSSDRDHRDAAGLATKVHGYDDVTVRG
jgi:hypothetical protein